MTADACWWCRERHLPCTEATHLSPLAPYVLYAQRKELAPMEITTEPVRTIVPRTVAAIVGAVVLAMLLISVAVTMPRPTSYIAPHRLPAVPTCAADCGFTTMPAAPPVMAGAPR